MLGVAEREHLERLAAAGMDLAREVVQLGGLPATRAFDPLLTPAQHLVVTAKLAHRLREPDVLVGLAQIPTKQRNDLLAVAVQDREPLPKPAGREPIAVGLDGDRLTQRGEPVLAERLAVANGVGLKEILVAEAEANDPRGELHRICDTGIARARMRAEQVSGEIADQARGVISLRLQDLDEVPDCALQKLDELARGGALGGRLELGDDRPGIADPLATGAPVQEPSRAQAAVDHLPQRAQVARRTGGGRASTPM